MKLKCSRGLTLKLPESKEECEFSKTLDVPLPEIKAFQEIKMELLALTQLHPQKDVGTIEHTVGIP